VSFRPFFRHDQRTRTFQHVSTPFVTDLCATLDLGSNSFHLLLARRIGGRARTVDRMKEKVQLIGGFEGGRLHPAAMRRGEAALALFAQRVAALPRRNIHMVGTHALREAENRGDFVAAAERILGVPLEIVSGDEEARLIYLGVARHVPRPAGRAVLVVDVGGGSTEIAWDGGPPPSADAPYGKDLRTASVKVGCVPLTERCFGPGVAQRAGFEAARELALAGLRGLGPIASGGVVFGTAGTIESVQPVLAANGWGAEGITAGGMRRLTDAILSGRWLVDAGLPGLPPDRTDIFPAGVALVDALFEVLGIDVMHHVDVSLPDGLMYRAFGYPPAEGDQRGVEVADLQQRFGVDLAQAARVRETALALFKDSRAWWTDPERWRLLLCWAAELHELGTAIAPRYYHRHGAYVLQHADLPGFSRLEQALLALMVRGHRRSFPGMAFRAYDPAVRAELERLLAVLRIAVILNRSHSDQHIPRVVSSVAGDLLHLTLSSGWLDAHPLSARELAVEAGQLRGAGLRLVFD
jgi:exopolyphosphatase / guanosine-5'-triphosphate,3'-diphosphate pyrophosphatase